MSGARGAFVTAPALASALADVRKAIAATLDTATTNPSDPAVAVRACSVLALLRAAEDDIGPEAALPHLRLAASQLRRLTVDVVRVGYIEDARDPVTALDAVERAARVLRRLVADRERGQAPAAAGRCQGGRMSSGPPCADS